MRLRSAKSDRMDATNRRERSWQHCDSPRAITMNTRRFAIAIAWKPRFAESNREGTTICSEQSWWGYGAMRNCNVFPWVATSDWDGRCESQDRPPEMPVNCDDMTSAEEQSAMMLAHDCGWKPSRASIKTRQSTWCQLPMARLWLRHSTFLGAMHRMCNHLTDDCKTPCWVRPNSTTNLLSASWSGKPKDALRYTMAEQNACLLFF